MGMVFGKISVATPKYSLIKSTSDYQIRHYSPSVIAQVTYSPSDMNDNKDAGFSLLAAYIGAFGNPQNTKASQISMTAPVITKRGEEETVTMQFMLPEEYKTATEAPGPVDARVVVVEEGERRYGVVRFSGVASEAAVEGKVGELRGWLERDGFKVVGEYVLGRYNPPWTLPMFRTNEVMLPVL